MPTEPAAWTHLLLFDGVCNLCDQTVQWVLAKDQRGLVKFCSIQSDLGTQLYRERGLDPAQPHSMMLITPEGVFVKSDAALHLARLMGGPWAVLAGLGQLIPRPLRDVGYAFIARNRYRFFGRKDQCWLPRPEWKARFVG